jgi:ATP-dependent DNA helicase RecG
MQPISSLRPGMKAAVLGEIKTANVSITRRRGFRIFHAVIADASGSIRCTWMNQAFLADILKPHLQVVVFGDVKLDSTGLHFMNPEFELISEDLSGIKTARIVPFYEKTGTVTPNMQRRIVRQALDQLPQDIFEPLPAGMRDRLGLVSRRVALEESHFPPNEASVDVLNAFRTAPQQRMIFEEFFLFQLGHAWRRHETSIEPKPWIPIVDDRIRQSAASVLPFKLTPGQRQAVKEIVDDMRLPAPMHRLLQGDVGAGKTIVALLAAIVAMENGLQVAFRDHEAIVR